MMLAITIILSLLSMSNADLSCNGMVVASLLPVPADVCMAYKDSDDSYSLKLSCESGSIVAHKYSSLQCDGVKNTIGNACDILFNLSSPFIPDSIESYIPQSAVCESFCNLGPCGYIKVGAYNGVESCDDDKPVLSNTDQVMEFAVVADICLFYSATSSLIHYNLTTQEVLQTVYVGTTDCTDGLFVAQYTGTWTNQTAYCDASVTKTSAEITTGIATTTTTTTATATTTTTQSPQSETFSTSVIDLNTILMVLIAIIMALCCLCILSGIYYFNNKHKESIEDHNVELKKLQFEMKSMRNQIKNMENTLQMNDEYTTTNTGSHSVEDVIAPANINHNKIDIQSIDNIILNQKGIHPKPAPPSQPAPSIPKIVPAKSEWNQDDLLKWVNNINLSDQLKEKIVNDICNGECNGHNILAVKSDKEVAQLFGIKDTMLCSKLWNEIQNIK